MKRSLSCASWSMILTMRKMLTLLMMMMFIFSPALFFRQKPKHNSGLHEEYDSRFPRLASSHYNLLLLPSLVVAAPLFISFRLNHLTCIRGMRKLSKLYSYAYSDVLAYGIRNLLSRIVRFLRTDIYLIFS